MSGSPWPQGVTGSAAYVGYSTGPPAEVNALAVPAVVTVAVALVTGEQDGLAAAATGGQSSAAAFVVAAVEVIRNNMAVRQQNDLRLYLDVVPDSSHVSALRYRIYLFHAHRVLA